MIHIATRRAPTHLEEMLLEEFLKLMAKPTGLWE